MSDEQLQLRFDGLALQSHTMDVTLIGPSLFALGELCEEANRILNGERTGVKVLLKADVEANCVTVYLEVVQTLWDAAKALLANDNIATAKEILEWIGIIKGTEATAGTAAVGGLLAYLRWKGNRRVISAKAIHQQAAAIGGNTFMITVQGDGNNLTITVPQQVHALSQSFKMVEAVKQLTAPVADCDGIDKATFIHNQQKVEIDKTFAEDVRKAYVDSENTEPQRFNAHITVWKPTLDPTSTKWQFKLGGRQETIDISNTTIAAKEFARGAVPGDTFYVKLERTEHLTRGGQYKADYKVLEVLDFKPGERSEQKGLL